MNSREFYERRGGGRCGRRENTMRREWRGGEQSATTYIHSNLEKMHTRQFSMYFQSNEAEGRGEGRRGWRGVRGRGGRER